MFSLLSKARHSVADANQFGDLSIGGKASPNKAFGYVQKQCLLIRSIRHQEVSSDGLFQLVQPRQICVDLELAFPFARLRFFLRPKTSLGSAQIVNSK